MFSRDGKLYALGLTAFMAAAVVHGAPPHQGPIVTTHYMPTEDDFQVVHAIDSDLDVALRSYSCANVRKVLNEKPAINYDGSIIDENVKVRFKTILRTALIFGDSECALELLDRVPFLRTERINSDDYAIHFACHYNRPSVIEALLRNSANKKAELLLEAKYHKTAFDIAMEREKRRPKSIRTLIDHGVLEYVSLHFSGYDIRKRASSVHLAATYASSCEAIERVVALRQPTVEQLDAAFWQAVSEDNSDAAKCFLGMLKRAGVERSLSATALVVVNDAELLRKNIQLIREQFSPIRKDLFGHTLLHRAAKAGAFHSIGVILHEVKHMGSGILKTILEERPTALHLAAKYSQRPEAVALLAQWYRARLDSVDTADFEGKTALYLAVEFNQVGNVKPLLNAGANVNAVDSKGITPLLRSILDYQYSEVAITKTLLATKKCDLTLVPPGSSSLLELTRQRGWCHRRGELVQEALDEQDMADFEESEDEGNMSIYGSANDSHEDFDEYSMVDPDESTVTGEKDSDMGTVVGGYEKYLTGYGDKDPNELAPYIRGINFWS